jgi:hypothetical protein
MIRRARRAAFGAPTDVDESLRLDRPSIDVVRGAPIVRVAGGQGDLIVS